MQQVQPEPEEEVAGMVEEGQQQERERVVGVGGW